LTKLAPIQKVKECSTKEKTIHDENLHAIIKRKSKTLNAIMKIHKPKDVEDVQSC
jgi:hypothetical protein